jgi:hypothetical protein
MRKKDIHSMLGPNYEFIDRIHQVMSDQNINWDASQYLFYFDDEREILHIIRKNLDKGKAIDPITSSYEFQKVANPNYTYSVHDESGTNPKFFLYPIDTLIPYEHVQIIYISYRTQDEFMNLYDQCQNNRKGNKYAVNAEIVRSFWSGMHPGIKVNPSCIIELTTYLTQYKKDYVDAEYDPILTYSPMHLFNHILLRSGVDFSPMYWNSLKIYQPEELISIGNTAGNTFLIDKIFTVANAISGSPKTLPDLLEPIVANSYSEPLLVSHGN